MNNNSKTFQSSSTSGDYFSDDFQNDIVSLQWNFSHNNMCFVKIQESLVMIESRYGNSLQRVEGWGACMKIDFTCFTISKIPDFERRSLRANIYI